jgi:hypothetical protein
MRAASDEKAFAGDPSGRSRSMRIAEDDAMRIAGIALLTLICAGCETYQTRKSAINAFGGVRSLENDDFDDVDDATVLGGELLLGLTYSGLGIEGGYAHAKADGGPLFSGTGSSDVETEELYVGLRETWNTDAVFQPYIGGGVSWLDANAEASSGFDDSDNSVAGYARAGLGWQFSSIQFGVDGRAMFGSDFEIDDEDTDLDYFQLLAFVGFSW